MEPMAPFTNQPQSAKFAPSKLNKVWRKEAAGCALYNEMFRASMSRDINPGGSIPPIMESQQMENPETANRCIALRAQTQSFDIIACRGVAAFGPIRPSNPINPTVLHAHLANLTANNFPGQLCGTRSRPIAKQVWKWSGFGLEMRQNLPVLMDWRLTSPVIPPTA
jgi:hypothetical protein